MNKPLVSVIIPCYNYGRFLSEAVASIVAQTFSGWECIIVDDGSEDDTNSIATKLAASDKRINYHLKKNGGLSSARNYGIRVSKGEFLCFLDADDLLDKKKLEMQLNCFFEMKSIDLVYGNSMFFESQNPEQLFFSKSKEAKSNHAVFSGTGEELILFLCRQNITVVSSPLVRKEVFDKVGLFDETYKSYEDWHFWFRCAINGCYFKYFDKPNVCTYIRFGHESMMSDKTKLIKASIQLRKYMAKHLPFKLRWYNLYRLFRSHIKYLFTV